jgi:RNA polymerase sigma factor (sigma-70 family)
MHDWELLKEYIEHSSQPAFAALVERHIDFVYSVCLRELRHAELAEDVTQVVFLILADKARTIRTGTVLMGWLFQTARFAARNALKQEMRRVQREQRLMEELMREAASLPASGSGATVADAVDEARWEDIESLLHPALQSLQAQERQVILLRFFANKSLRETGEELGISDDAARKRIARAVEKLRRYFARYGLLVSGVVLTGLISQHAVIAAPAHLGTAVMPTSAPVAGHVTAEGVTDHGVAALHHTVAKAILITRLKAIGGTLAALSLAAMVGILSMFAPRSPRREAMLLVVRHPATSHHSSKATRQVAELSGQLGFSSIQAQPSRRRAAQRQDSSAYRAVHAAINWPTDVQLRTRRITMKMRSGTGARHKRRTSNTAKLVSTLLATGAAVGATGTTTVRAQPPASSTPNDAPASVATGIAQKTAPEDQSSQLAIEARFVEMSSRDLDSFGIDFTVPPPTVLNTHTISGGKPGVEEVDAKPKNEAPTGFAFGQAQPGFKAQLDALIAQKRAKLTAKNPAAPDGIYNILATSRDGNFRNMRFGASNSAPLMIGSSGLVDSNQLNQAKIGRPNLYLTTSLGLDVTATPNSDGTITLTMRSPVQMYLQTGLEATADTVTIFSRSTQPIEISTKRVHPIPAPVLVRNGDGPPVRVAPPPNIILDPASFRGGTPRYLVSPQAMMNGGRKRKDETVTVTQSADSAVTIPNNGTVAIRGIRIRTVRQGDRDITLWTYVPTLGRLLSNDEGTEAEKELVVFVTASLQRVG